MNGSYHPGVYTVEVRAWADNEYDTGVFQRLEITVIDPCQSITLGIDDTVFKTVPDVTLT